MLQLRLLIQKGRRSFECTKPKKGPKSSCIQEETVAMNVFLAEDEEDIPEWDVTTSMRLQTAQAWANIQDRRQVFGCGFLVFCKKTGEHRNCVA